MLESKFRALVALTAALAAAACAPAPRSSSRDILGGDGGGPVPNVGQRDLTSQEKKIITDSLAASIRDAGSAKFRWAKFPILVSPQGTVNYCAMVNAKSPFPAYNGWQNYIVETRVAGGKVSSAVVGLIAGGKDAALVTKMCAKYGLNPNDAT